MSLPIYKPQIKVDESRRRLIELLSQQLSERLISENSNIAEDEIVLSEAEERELEGLVAAVLSDRSFLSMLQFADQISQYGLEREGYLRELYLAERKRRGRSRAVSSSHWYSFITRFGLRQGDLSTLVRSADKMPFEHFVRMEARLIHQFQVPYRAREYILAKIAFSRARVEAVREVGEAKLRDIRELEIQKNSKAFLEEIAKRRSKLSINQVAGLATVVINTTAIFTTRDWSVAGTLSTIAGGAVMAS